MLAVHRKKDKVTSVMIIVGTPEVIIRKSEEVLWRDTSKKMSNTMRREFSEYQDYISSGGSRMVAVAYKKVSNKKRKNYIFSLGKYETAM